MYERNSNMLVVALALITVLVAIFAVVVVNYQNQERQEIEKMEQELQDHYEQLTRVAQPGDVPTESAVTETLPAPPEETNIPTTPSTGPVPIQVPNPPAETTTPLPGTCWAEVSADNARVFAHEGATAMVRAQLPLHTQVTVIALKGQSVVLEDGSWMFANTVIIQDRNCALGLPVLND